MYNFTQQQKDFLIEYGYLILDTYDYTHDAINEASDELKKVVDNNLFTKLTLTRNTLTSEQLDFITNNFPNVKFTNDKIDEWIGTQSDLESIQTYIFKNSSTNTINNIPQIWMHTGNENNKINLNLFLDLKIAIANQLYDYTNENLKDQKGFFTMFSEGGYIMEHQDAGYDSNRLCVILFYLNDKSEAEGNGGELGLVDNKGNRILIPPYKGSCVILDFAGNDGILRNNISHYVTKVKSNFKRYTYLSGIALQKK